MAPRSISKSRFIAGLQCEKRLWLEIYKRELADEIDEQTKAIFDQGHEIGVLAQSLYPGGVLIDEDYKQIPKAILSTVKAVNAGAETLYEATALHDRFLARADILHRIKEGTNEWDMIEVKGSTSVKDVYLYDLAIQKHIFEWAGYRIRKTILCHINNDYVRDGDIEVEKLFTQSDETAAVNLLLKNLSLLTEKMLRIADSTKEPKVPIGKHCTTPYECPFMGHCWKDVPEDSIFNLAGRKDFVWELYEKGFKKMVHIPNTIRLSVKQRRQIDVARTGKPYWRIAGIQGFLDKLEYPLSFLDFETVMLAIPPYDGTWPFGSIPTQFSLHVIEKPGDAPQHFEFLGDGFTDPRQPFMAALVKAMPRKGSIVIYSQYEATILKQTVEFLPKYKSQVIEFIQRFMDLLVPFRNQDVIYPAFNGSASLKAVLPVLVPDMSYDDLEIGEGGAAVQAYVQLMDPEVQAAIKKKIRKDLLDYCGQDTMAMVKLVEVLKSKVKN